MAYSLASIIKSLDTILVGVPHNPNLSQPGLRELVSFKDAAVIALDGVQRDFQPDTSSNTLAVLFALLDKDASILKRLRTLLEGVNISRFREIISHPKDYRLEPIPDILVDISNLFTTYQHLAQLHETLKRFFFKRPFHNSTKNLYGLQPREEQLTMRFNRIWSDRHSNFMKGVGRIWVDQNLGEVTIPNIARVQTGVIQNLPTLIDQESSTFKSLVPRTDTLLHHLKIEIEKELARANNDRFSIAFCGMVKAGKSLFLNALAGHAVLPSDELPSTAWPCRVQHVKGQRIPTLEVNHSHFKSAIDTLKQKKYGALMANFKVPKDGLDSDDEHESEEEDFKDNSVDMQIYNNWIDLHPTTKDNLCMFEEENFQFPSAAEGEKDVADVLAQVNDIVRLCQRLKISIPSLNPEGWPLLKVEFESLKDKNLSGEFEFIDIPGIGESANDNFHYIEDLVRVVAKVANTVVPIVSFKEISKDDWRQEIPEIIKTALGRAPELVLCTHLDQVAPDHIDQQVASVATVFWPNSDDARHRVLCCSSRMGISARTLLQHSATGKPKFEDIWEESHPAYDCAEKILGVAIPKKKFGEYSSAEWTEVVKDELKESKLEAAVTHLTTDIVMKARGRTLKIVGEQLRRKIKFSIDDQRRLLLGMSRSSKEYEEAYEAFKRISANFQQALAKWASDESRIRAEDSQKFQGAFQALEVRSFGIVSQAIQITIEEDYKHIKVENSNDLKFNRKADMESCLLSIQHAVNTLLAPIKREFVSFVRDLASRSCAARFDSLSNNIQTFKSNMYANLIEEITGKLVFDGDDIPSSLLSRIKHKDLYTTVSKPHNISTAHHAIQNMIAKPFLNKSAQSGNLKDTKANDVELGYDSTDDASERAGDVGQLGFMLRAPVAVLASIPLLFTAGIWRFMSHSKIYLLNSGVLSQKLRELVIRPYLDGLKKEGLSALDGMSRRSAEVARYAVEEALEEEERRFRQEQRLKIQPLSVGSVAPSMDVATSSMTVLLNLLAAESGLLRLREHLDDRCLDKT